MQTKPEFLAVWEWPEQLLASPRGAPMWGRAGWVAVPCAEGLKWPCPGSLLCKGGGVDSALLQGWGAPPGGGDTLMGGGPGCTWPPPYPSRLPRFPAWVFCFQTQFWLLLPKPISTPAAFSSPSPCLAPGRPRPAHGLILQTTGTPLPVALARTTGSGTARCLGERWV